MKSFFSLALAVVVSLGMGTAHATDASDVTSQLDDNHITIRSMLDPAASISKSDPVSVVLPDKATVADKQLAELFRLNLSARGFTVTTPDKSKWTFVATVEDKSTVLGYSEHHFFHLSYTPETGDVDYALVSIIVCRSADMGDAAWTSSVRAYSDFWITHQEDVIKAILATYGKDYYYRDTRPSKVAESSEDDHGQVTSIEELKACLTGSDPKSC